MILADFTATTARSALRQDATERPVLGAESARATGEKSEQRSFGAHVAETPQDAEEDLPQAEISAPDTAPIAGLEGPEPRERKSPFQARGWPMTALPEPDRAKMPSTGDASQSQTKDAADGETSFVPRKEMTLTQPSSANARLSADPVPHDAKDSRPDRARADIAPKVAVTAQPDAAPSPKTTDAQAADKDMTGPAGNGISRDTTDRTVVPPAFQMSASLQGNRTTPLAPAFLGKESASAPDIAHPALQVAGRRPENPTLPTRSRMGAPIRDSSGLAQIILGDRQANQRIDPAQAKPAPVMALRAMLPFDPSASPLQPTASPDADGLPLTRGEGAVLTSSMQSGAGSLVPVAMQGVAAQLGMQIVNTRQSRFEISLSPEELGKVRITLQPADGRLQIFIFSERPETQDLLRRNTEDLMRELRALGYDAVDLDFADKRDQQSMDQQTPETLQKAAPPDLIAAAAPPIRVLSGILDLRI